jgi:hypothetical protein
MAFDQGRLRCSVSSFQTPFLAGREIPPGGRIDFGTAKGAADVPKKARKCSCHVLGNEYRPDAVLTRAVLR